MPEEVTIRLYQIKKCGYYPLRSSVRSFGGIAETLQQLHDWVHDPRKSLADTKVFDVVDASGLDPVYCFDIKRHESGLWLLVTWNKSHTTNGRVASVDGTRPVGVAGVTLTDPPPGGIPGYPTYFLFLPNQSTLATVQFDGFRNGHMNMCEYLRQFLAKYSAYVVEVEPDDGEDVICGYSPSENEDPMPDVVPRFESAPLTVPGPVEFIRQNRERIRKVIRRNKLSFSVPNERNMLLRLLSLQSVGNAEVHQGIVKTRYEVNIRLSDEELEALIGEWERHGDDAKWQDVGFVVDGDAKIHWLGRAYCRTEIEVNVEPDGAGIVDAQALLAELYRNRAAILSMIPRND